ncbi:MAG: phosphoserine phosphatase SerB [Proteobacteria bacterium]|uniref:Phosphoserine phosphatase n=1 Tax=Candidatus Avisuccinivibrio stercorigallinarum TaxID=2840704 RepID=A0A9D9D981_9GAMM|nr:phosphoserine phosphatase SerB [Candidatus Avisuccinivibrio stercorigallinarum]
MNKYFFVIKPGKDKHSALRALCADALALGAQELAFASDFGCSALLCAACSLQDKHFEALKAECAQDQADLLSFDALPSLNKPGCIIMDMDMTSVTIEGIDEIARELGVYEQVAALTSSAMHGKADFASSLQNRVALLRGGSAAVIETVKARMFEMPGLEELLTLLKAHGFKCAIASGGFHQLISVLEQKYQLDLVRANTLGVEHGLFTGRVEGPIIDAEGKRQALIELRGRFGIVKEQSIAMGDGANDLKMIGEAGFGLAYHAKPAVTAAAPHALTYCDHRALALCLQFAAQYFD